MLSHENKKKETNEKSDIDADLITVNNFLGSFCKGNKHYKVRE